MNLKRRAIIDLEPIVALTGAGISAESGVPTFRGDQGLWRQYRAQDLATPQAFERDPHLVWQFYDWRRQIVASCKPNPAHSALAEIEQYASEFSIITQNVDGLHSQAGNKKVIELHGSLWVLRCTICGDQWIDRKVPLPDLPPRCQKCDGIARPDVVWFGEKLNPNVLEAAQRSAINARTLLVIGTSALVQPASLLPLIAQQAGASVIEFNLEPTPITPHVDMSIQGPAGQELPIWWESIRGNVTGEITVPE